jgi:hypothetical protein
MTINQEQIVVSRASRRDYLVDPTSGVLHLVLGAAYSHRDRFWTWRPDPKLRPGIVHRPRSERPLPRVALVHSGTSQMPASGGSVTSAE